MKQIFLNLSTGRTEIQDVPIPPAKSGYLRLLTRQTLVSAGTERMFVEFGRGSLRALARSQPEKFKQLLEKLHTDGLLPTLEAGSARLQDPLPMGYSHVGVVDGEALDASVSGFHPGDRVLSNGPHAEVVSVPRNLCVRIPDAVTDEQAVFGVVGAIALQGMRLAEPTLGETFAVTGLGLIGLLAVQLLRAAGCRVLAMDPDPHRVRLAESFGARALVLDGTADPVGMAFGWTGNQGVDAVLVTAATESSEPVNQGALMCRKRGRVVLVGVTGLHLDRRVFYEKEITFRVSCSYGPGRYDPNYEEKGIDYPNAYVRWTARRNFEAVLDLMAQGKLDTAPLLTHTFPLEQCAEAYQVLEQKPCPALGITLQCTPSPDPLRDPLARALRPAGPSLRASSGKPQDGGIGFIGSGTFAAEVLLPALQKSGNTPSCLVSGQAAAAGNLGRRFGIGEVATEENFIFENEKIDTVFIATRHHSHGRLVLKALEAGKNVYVEKPLCLRKNELMPIVQACFAKGRLEDRPGALLAVGFNRRFAPHARIMKHLLGGQGAPKQVAITVNAGPLPAGHWLLDPEIGGGRLIGEGCHFIDFCRFLIGEPLRTVQAASLEEEGLPQSFAITLTFADGSLGTIQYCSNGSRKFPKERVEVFCGGKILQLDNFRTLRGYGWPGFTRKGLWRQDKGHRASLDAFLGACRGGRDPGMDFNELVEVTLATFAADDACREGRVISFSEYLQQF